MSAVEALFLHKLTLTKLAGNHLERKPTQPYHQSSSDMSRTSITSLALNDSFVSEGSWSQRASAYRRSVLTRETHCSGVRRERETGGESEALCHTPQ